MSELGQIREMAGPGQHVRSTLKTAPGRRAACPPCAQRFIEGMNQLFVPVLSLLQLRKEPGHERNKTRENRNRREAERIV